MERNTQKIGLVNLLVLLLLAGASAGLSIYSNTLGGQAATIFLGAGFLIAAISYFQMRLEESERLEKLEFEELTKGKEASLFNTTDAEVFPAQRSREQFERFLVPGFTVLLLLLESAAVYWIWTWLKREDFEALQQPTIAMSLYGLFALVLFLLGKYSAGVARLQAERLLRPGASFLLLDAYVCFAVAGCIAAVQLGFPLADRIAAYVLGGVLALVAVETLIGLVLEIYRPRVKGKVGRVLYESRLVGLLAQPEGLFTTAAQALDYQFGFKVSETWFYRFLERALAWIILAQVLVLILSTCFVFIGPGEQGLIERFGRPLSDRAVLEPGLHFKLPWPIDRVYREQTRAIQTFNIGYVPDPEKEKEKTVVWTVPHTQEEFNLLVGSRAGRGGGETGVPADLLSVSIPVQYRIKDLRAWAYNSVDAAKLLENIAMREVVRYLLGVDLIEIMSTKKAEAAAELKQRIQEEASSLGVEIVFVGLQDVHPPVKVAKAFEDVVGARQGVEAKLREAEGYAARTRALAEAEAVKRVRNAEAYAAQTVFGARARAAQFTNQVVAYKAAPAVFAHRAHLKALEEGMTNARKYVVTVTNTEDVVNLNLEDRVAPRIASDVVIPEAD